LEIFSEKFSWEWKFREADFESEKWRLAFSVLDDWTSKNPYYEP